MSTQFFNPITLGFISEIKNISWFLSVSRKPRIKVLISKFDGQWEIQKYSNDSDDESPEAHYKGNLPNNDFARSVLINMGIPVSILVPDNKCQ